MDGAAESVRVRRAPSPDGAAGGYAIDLAVIGGGAPFGLCGSGLLSALAELWAAGAIDRAGRATGGRSSFTIVPAAESGSAREIALTDDDVSNLMRAKAAIFAGIRRMLSAVGLTPQDIRAAYIAGGFGRTIDIGDAIRIGMLPDIGAQKYAYVGNSSLRGAELALMDIRLALEAERLARSITYIELSEGNEFMDEFVQALFLPHTDLSLFKHVEGA
jgi:uncharacterized 2Fe-2S/4Fe-4S cluster protein (DUF4445 family)